MTSHVAVVASGNGSDDDGDNGRKDGGDGRRSYGDHDDLGGGDYGIDERWRRAAKEPADSSLIVGADLSCVKQGSVHLSSFKLVCSDLKLFWGNLSAYPI